MAKKREIGIRFPLGGVDKSGAYRDQPPFTTPSALNVWPFESIEGRGRGGSRPGLKRAFSGYTWTSGFAQAIQEVSYTSGGSTVQALILIANGSVRRSVDGGAFSTIMSGLSTTEQLQMAVHGQKLFVAQSSGYPKYYDFLTGASGTMDTIQSYYTLKYRANQAYTLYRRNNVYEWMYDPDGEPYPGWPFSSVTETAYAGSMYETPYDFSEAWAYNASDKGYPPNVVYVVCTEDNELYDYDSASPFLFKNESDVLIGWRKGLIPQGCPLTCRYQDRLVLAGSPAHVWYMSRVGDPFDFDYAVSQRDYGRAVAGSSSEAGAIGEPLTALIPWGDDYLIFGCATSLWVLRGSPTLGGTIGPLSRNIGIVDRNAWCYGPEGQVLFLSHAGIYMISGPQQQEPQPISRRRLPGELLDVDVDSNYVSLAYDTFFRGVHIAITPTDGLSHGTHYWFDWDSQSFWPVQYGSVDYQPTAMGRFQNVVYLGGHDTQVYQYDREEEQDGDALAFDTHLLYGPIRLGKGDRTDGLVTELQAVLGQGSGDVDWELYVGDNEEAVVDAAAAGVSGRHSNGTWVAGLNRLARPRARGAVAVLRVEARLSTKHWVIERVAAVIREAGRTRY